MTNDDAAIDGELAREGARSRAASEVAEMTTAALERESERLEGIDEPTVAESARWDAVERELDARALWDHDDARVRESVGNYRPAPECGVCGVGFNLPGDAHACESRHTPSERRRFAGQQ